MPIDRFFIETALQTNSELIIEDQEFHHLSRVTRTNEGDEIEVVNGKGQLAKANVDKIKKKNAIIRINSITEVSPPNLRTILVQAIPRINRLEFIVEKGTELGMSELWLFPGDKSEKKELSENQINRLRTISVSAMKQCGRLYLPPIVILPSLAKWKKYPSFSYFGDISEKAPTIIEQWQNNDPHNELCFFIGPESGFSSFEEKILIENKIKGVSIHNNILRTDTAAITALAITHELQYLSSKFSISLTSKGLER